MIAAEFLSVYFNRTPPQKHRPEGSSASTSFLHCARPGSPIAPFLRDWGGSRPEGSFVLVVVQFEVSIHRLRDERLPLFSLALNTRSLTPTQALVNARLR